MGGLRWAGPIPASVDGFGDQLPTRRFGRAVVPCPWATWPIGEVRSVTAPIEVNGSDTQVRPEAVLDGVDRKAIEGRSLGRIAWTRLKRDKVALGGGIVVLLLCVLSLPGVTELVVKAFGHPPNEYHTQLLDPTFGTPHGKFGGMSSKFLFGIEPTNGRDLFSRILYG